MPLYIPWLTETIKKRGVRYLLHHYLGQFFEEKLTLDQLSIDIYEGKGSIKNLTLDVDGLNDELDFIPFRFLDGCLIGQISVEVPWSSLATDACKVELEGAKFFCRLKTTADAAKPHCTESTLISRSLMTSSMQMAEEIVTTEDDDESDLIDQANQQASSGNIKQGSNVTSTRKKDANQMFEGLEMFAQLIDSVLRRTKLTARNTLFQIQPYQDRDFDEKENDDTNSTRTSSSRHNQASSISSGDEFSEPMVKSDDEEGNDDDDDSHSYDRSKNASDGTIEFFIKFFRCEEMIDQTKADGTNLGSSSASKSDDENDGTSKSLCAIPETITKLLTLEDVEMRIDGVPVSNLIGTHTITIKFNGQKSEISVFSGSPLLAVIGHKQLETFFNVFDGPSGQDMDSSFIVDKNQKMMSPEDYAKIENQLLESASLRNMHTNDIRTGSNFGIGVSSNKSPYYVSTQVGSSGSGGRRWADNVNYYAGSSQTRESTEYDYHSPSSSTIGPICSDSKQSSISVEPTLDHIEAFSCELKLPGIWLCILRDGEALPQLIKPHADSINSFPIINKYIDKHIKVPHIRCLALKVALNITATGTNLFLGDLDISEHLEDASRMSPIMKLLHNDQTNAPMNTARYKASISNGKDITIDLLAKTRIMFDPTIIDRIVFDYKLVKLNQSTSSKSRPHRQLSSRANLSTNLKHQQRGNHTDLNIVLRGEELKFELLCPIPDLTPGAHKKRTQLRPQSFLFNFKDIVITWQSDKLKISSNELLAYVKTQPKQTDSEAVKFIEATSKGNDKISVELEPSPSNLDDAFENDVEQALTESSMYNSIYVSQATESRIPTDPFQTKRKVVRASFQSHQTSNKPNSARISECDHEKILTPGDRQHLLNYLNQTVMSTRLSLILHLPVCGVEFEDKEQLDLIYNRFGNDFVFWQPNALTKNVSEHQPGQSSKFGGDDDSIKFKQPNKLDYSDERDDPSSGLSDNADSETSYHSMSHDDESNQSDCYDNEVTCKIIVDELFVKFNHQSCASALKQEISAENFLMGVIIDVNKKPNTLLSMVADNLELCTDLETVLEGNFLGDKNSIFSLTAEIKRPTKQLKDIKLAIQFKNGLFNDFRTETYTRFWQSINVTDEPILGYIAPQIVTELHIDILNTSLLLVREDARPALLSIDELYLTSMVMEQTSQVMIRLIADEVSLYMKRDKQGLETMKNYICLIDSGLIDLDVKFSDDNRIEFGVINNVITVRVCQDSLSALCKLFNVLIKNSSQNNKMAAEKKQPENFDNDIDHSKQRAGRLSSDQPIVGSQNDFNQAPSVPHLEDECEQQHDENSCDSTRRDREINLLVDAMNDYTLASSNSFDKTDSKQHNDSGSTAEYVNARGDYDERSEDESDEDSEANESDDSSGDENNDDEEEAEEEDDDDDDDDDDDGEGEKDYDSDAPPSFQKTDSPSSNEGYQKHSNKIRDPNTCILDQSNPMLGDMFSQPLLPSTRQLNSINIGNSTTHNDGSNLSNHSFTDNDNHKAMDESGFFVIGNDDVGAGIMDKRHHEPVVRKLINGPINIIENHFKMTKPRTIPEMLATSLERYVLEEMTLVVNLYGGHDFDDEDSTNDDTSSTAQISDLTDQASEATNELLDTISAESQFIRSRTGSIAGTRRQLSTESNTSSLKRGKLGGRRKHLSEGSGGAKWDPGSGGKTAEARVRFGEGAVNLWESLDLMSSPDFLGTRSRPSQPPLNSDLKQAGGTWREDDVCIQLTLSKVKLLYEVADGTSKLANTKLDPKSQLAATESVESNLTPPISWRFMLFIQDIEVKDRIAASDINKMLYEYCTESMPKRSTQMLSIKNVATINPSDGCEECDLRVSLKPLRLNVDQDTLLFLIDFCTTFCKSLAKQQQQQLQQQQQSSIYPSGGVSSASARSSRSSMAAPVVNPSKQAACDRGAGGDAALSRTLSRHQADAPSGSCGSGTGKVLPDSKIKSTRPGAFESKQKFDTKNNRRVEDSELTSSASSSSCTSIASSLSTSHKISSDSNGGRNGNCSNGSSSSDDESALRGKRGKRKRNFNRTGQDVNESNITVTTTATIITTSTTTSTSATKATRKQPHGRSTNKGSTKTAASAATATEQAPLPTHCHTDNVSGSANHQPIYIKSFTFSPDVPIRIDYHAKHLDFEQGALAGILMGLAHLDHSELILRRVQAKHGMRGLDRVLLFAINSWLSDIKRNQLPSILGGVGPMHSVIQLFQGMRDLVWMPIDHYRKDGRLVRGLQRGASSFSSSTAMAAINLVNRFISIVQCTAQIAHDIVTPPTMSSTSNRRFKPLKVASGGGGQLSSSGSSNARRNRHHHSHSIGSQSHDLSGHDGRHGPGTSSTGGGLNQPRNFCEGVAVGFTILKEGFNDTARNVTVGMQAEDMRSAVGELVRQIPSTLLNPIISATEGAQSVLVGIRNQIAPDARREDQEKWKGRVRGK